MAKAPVRHTTDLHRVWYTPPMDRARATRLLLSAAILAGCGGLAREPSGRGAGARYVMRVDRTFDRSAQPALPSQGLAEETYRPIAPADRWEVTINGSNIVLTAMGKPTAEVERLEGKEIARTPGEHRFDLEKGTFAGGSFIMRGDDAELTIFGSGVPVVSSERGKLFAR